MSWLVYNKHDKIVADVETEEEACQIVEDLTEDSYWKFKAPYRIEMAT